MVNFNIIETDSTKEFNEIYSKIKEDLSNGLLIWQIQKKHDLTKGQWRRYYKQLVQDGLKKPRKKGEYTPRYYTINKRHYVVQKFYGSKKNHIGSFRCEYDAQKCVKLMKECNWDLTKKKEIVEQVKKESEYKYNGVKNNATK